MVPACSFIQCFPPNKGLDLRTLAHPHPCHFLHLFCRFNVALLKSKCALVTVAVACPRVRCARGGNVVENRPPPLLRLLQVPADRAGVRVLGSQAEQAAMPSIIDQTRRDAPQGRMRCAVDVRSMSFHEFIQRYSPTEETSPSAYSL